MHYFSSVVFAQKGFKVEKIDGILIVSNPKTPIPKNGLKKRIIFKEELSIGVIEGDDNYMFGTKIDLNTDDEGNFYVSDYANKRIQKFDSKGKYIITIGRKGQGPGEFEYLSKVKFNNEDNLYVNDPINKRVSFFDKKGIFLRQIRIPVRFRYLAKNFKDFIVGSKPDLIREKDVEKSVTNFGLFNNEFNPIVVLCKKEEEIAQLNEGNLAIAFTQDAFRPNLIHTITAEDIIYLGYPNIYEINGPPITFLVFCHIPLILKAVSFLNSTVSTVVRGR